jgi:hypothetical protein
MSRTASLKAETVVAVHVFGIDPDLRVLLDREAADADPGKGWSLPSAILRTGEDPSSLAQYLMRRAGARPKQTRVVEVESAYQDGVQRFDLLFECRAETAWVRPATGGLLWWSLDEIASLTLTPVTRRAIVSRWTSIWPHV